MITESSVIIPIAKIKLNNTKIFIDNPKIYKPKKLIDSIEYFFGEDQGRYLIEIDKNNRKKIESLLKENNIFSEVIAEVQNDIFEIEKTFSIKVSDLYNSNNQWYHKFNAIK